MAELQGTRANSMQEVWNGDPGVYWPKPVVTIPASDSAIECLWFKLPTGTVGRIANQGHEKDGEEAWTITVNEDQTVTVDPSIDQQAEPRWHGHLVNGVWRD